MKRLTAIVVLALAVAAVPATAQARRAWTNTAPNIESLVLNHWNTSDGESIADVACWGDWSGVVARANHRWWFHKLGCNEWDDLNRKFQLQIIVTGPGKQLNVTEIACDDSASDSSCP
jgi:hypothetical protein